MEQVSSKLEGTFFTHAASPATIQFGQHGTNRPLWLIASAPKTESAHKIALNAQSKLLLLELSLCCCFFHLKYSWLRMNLLCSKVLYSLKKLFDLILVKRV